MAVEWALTHKKKFHCGAQTSSSRSSKIMTNGLRNSRRSEIFSYALVCVIKKTEEGKGKSSLAGPLRQSAMNLGGASGVVKIIPFLLLLLTVCLPAQAGTVSSAELIQEEFQYLSKLKTENPQAYKEAIAAKKSALRERTQKIKSRGGERFQSFKKEEGRKRREHLRQFKEKDPRGFEGYVENRLKHMERLQKKNPERFQQMMESHPRMKEHFNQFQENQNRRKESGERPLNSVRSENPNRAEKPELRKVQSERIKASSRVHSERTHRDKPAGESRPREISGERRRAVRENVNNQGAVKPRSIQERRMSENQSLEPSRKVERTAAVRETVKARQGQHSVGSRREMNPRRDQNRNPDKPQAQVVSGPQKRDRR